MQKLVQNCLPTKKRCFELKEAFSKNIKCQSKKESFLKTYQDPYCNYCKSLNLYIEASHQHIFTDCPLAQSINKKLFEKFDLFFSTENVPPWFSFQSNNNNNDPNQNLYFGDIGLIPKQILTLTSKQKNFNENDIQAPSKRDLLISHIHAHIIAKWKIQRISTHTPILNQHNLDIDSIIENFLSKWIHFFNLKSQLSLLYPHKNNPLPLSKTSVNENDLTNLTLPF